MYMTKVIVQGGEEFFRIFKEDSLKSGYFDHQLLWKLFPNDGSKRRDFLFLREEGSRLPQFLLVSRDRPSDYPGLALDCKLYEPSIPSGSELRFKLKANPVIAKKSPIAKHSVKHDVWMNAKWIARQENKSVEETAQDCEGAVLGWLKRQGDKKGFTVQSAIVDGYIQNRVYKRKHKGIIQFSSIHFEGILKVTDAEKFKSTLFGGIGSSKAFGCGLLLVRRI